jgi:hypothetical protein
MNLSARFVCVATRRLQIGAGVLAERHSANAGVVDLVPEAQRVLILRAPDRRILVRRSVGEGGRIHGRHHQLGEARR